MAALRSFLDVNINYYNMSRMEAELIYNKYAWGSSTVAFKDITRFQSSPGVVTSYMIGQMTFVKARRLMEESLGPKFSLPEFHYQVLRQGEIPLEYLLKYIRDLSHRWPYHQKRTYLWLGMYLRDMQELLRVDPVMNIFIKIPKSGITRITD